MTSWARSRGRRRHHGARLPRVVAVGDGSTGCAAAAHRGGEVVLLRRTAALRDGISAETTIVEIASDVVVVSVSGRIAAVVPAAGRIRAATPRRWWRLSVRRRRCWWTPPRRVGAELLARRSPIACARSACRQVRRRRTGSGARPRRNDHARVRRRTSPFGDSGWFRDRKALAVLPACCRRWCCVAVSRPCMTASNPVDTMRDDVAGRGQGRCDGAGDLDCAAHHVGPGIGSGAGCFTGRRRHRSARHAVRSSRSLPASHRRPILCSQRWPSEPTASSSISTHRIGARTGMR